MKFEWVLQSFVLLKKWQPADLMHKDQNGIDDWLNVHIGGMYICHAYFRARWSLYCFPIHSYYLDSVTTAFIFLLGEKNQEFNSVRFFIHFLHFAHRYGWGKSAQLDFIICKYLTINSMHFCFYFLAAEHCILCEKTKKEDYSWTQIPGLLENNCAGFQQVPFTSISLADGFPSQLLSLLVRCLQLTSCCPFHLPPTFCCLFYYSVHYSAGRNWAFSQELRYQLTPLKRSLWPRYLPGRQYPHSWGVPEQSGTKWDLCW